MFAADSPIGFHLIDASRTSKVRVKGGLSAFTPDGVRFADGTCEWFDAVIVATGYRVAPGLLDGAVRTDPRGFALRRDRVTSADLPGLFFVGHTNDATGALLDIRRDAPLVARAIADASQHTRP